MNGWSEKKKKNQLQYTQRFRDSDQVVIENDQFVVGLGARFQDKINIVQNINIGGNLSVATKITFVIIME